MTREQAVAALRVPIVGAPLTAHVGYVMASYTCCCDASNEPALIRGTDLVDQCGRCGKCYAIVSVSFNRAQGHVQPSVGVAQVPVPSTIRPSNGETV